MIGESKIDAEKSRSVVLPKTKMTVTMRIVIKTINPASVPYWLYKNTYFSIVMVVTKDAPFLPE